MVTLDARKTMLKVKMHWWNVFYWKLKCKPESWKGKPLFFPQYSIKHRHLFIWGQHYGKIGFNEKGECLCWTINFTNKEYNVSNNSLVRWIQMQIQSYFVLHFLLIFNFNLKGIGQHCSQFKKLSCMVLHAIIRSDEA